MVEFRQLRLGGWQQFASVDIEFHERLTVITGANGAGKSTLLNILATHVGINRPHYGIPIRDPNGSISYAIHGISPETRAARDGEQIGEIQYTSGAGSKLLVPRNPSRSYDLVISNRQTVPGLAIGSHRLLASYHPVRHLPFVGVKPDDFLGKLISDSNNRYLGQSAGSDQSMIFHIKETLAAWAALGEGNSTLQPDPEQRNAFEGFVRILRKVLPASLGFIDLAIRPPDVVLRTRSGEFMLDAASGGITSLIEIGALIYALSIHSAYKDRRFAVIHDEPENHLHPLLQRTLYKSLVEAFPNVQFVVATHSPFIVSSLRDANVYALTYEATGDGQMTDRSRVVSQKLDYVNRAGNASEILREVLGLPNTLPAWVEQSIESIVGKYVERGLDASVLEDLKTELTTAGLRELFPNALSSLAKRRD